MSASDYNRGLQEGLESSRRTLEETEKYKRKLLSEKEGLTNLLLEAEDKLIKAKCNWGRTIDETGMEYFVTTCRKEIPLYHKFEKQGKFKYCPYCGGEIKL